MLFNFVIIQNVQHLFKKDYFARLKMLFIYLCVFYDKRFWYMKLKVLYVLQSYINWTTFPVFVNSFWLLHATKCRENGQGLQLRVWKWPGVWMKVKSSLQISPWILKNSDWERPTLSTWTKQKFDFRVVISQ